MVLLLAQRVQPEQIPVYFHLAGINATEQKPFEIYVNGQQIYKQTQDLGDRMAIVTGRLPNVDDLRVTVKAVSLLDGLEEESEVNVSKYGNYIKLEVSSDRSVIDITQSKNAEFDNATIVDSKKMPKSIPKVTPSTTSTTTTAKPAASTGGSEDYLDVLKKLGELRKAGILTEEEFQAKKKQVLGL